MSSCIITVIKNEHEYLDEWIQYNLNLGINHIFIFEDINSLSHKDICNKYKDNVSLSNVLTLYDYDTQQKILINVNNLCHIQQSYFKKSLKYIYENYNYNWCFVIDIDEYITIEDKYKNINEVLNEYNEYDAILLTWMNFGANGLINKPDYSKKGIIETYTKRCNFSGIDKHMWVQRIKTVYNMKHFNDNLFRSDHIPNMQSHWCRTNYSQNTEDLIYDKIYLRHYITKSWEEYIWKLNIRGMFYKYHRNYNSFFEMNTDMINKKEELIKMINKNRG